MTRTKHFLAAAAAVVALGLPVTASSQEIPAADPAAVDAVIRASFTKLPEGWASRIEQDETQRECSLARNRPSAEQAAAIEARETAKLVFPADGVLMGDWKAGEKIAQNGRGGQFSDPPGTVSGGNCYACHQLAPQEVSFGTLGPSLTGYGRDRNYGAEDIKAAYAKMYDAEAAFPCSTMPRFGVSGVLDEQQIKDLVAFLFDPASPVNK
jgi:sulfur-oxidizing protein SoxX